MTRLWAIAIAGVIIGGGARAARAQADAEHEAYVRAQPVFDKYCTKCHSTTSPGKDDLAIEHLDMTSYPFGGHHGAEAGAEVREAMGAGPAGEEATMPDDAPGSVQGVELALVLAWADAFDRAHGGAAETPDMGDMHVMHMDEHMHDMPGMRGDDMQMHGPLGLAMSREGSGTAWQPDATREAMHMRMRGGWMLMLHYALDAGFDAQSGNRGDSKPIGLGWIMGMASREVGGGLLGVRAMISPEAPVLGKSGYPLLLQTGEEVGEGLIDHQHPHDLFMELAVRYQRATGHDLAIDLYAALAGEPALGPVAFAHRPYALYDMTAPIGHHWMDSTHISFGVLTAGVYTRDAKLEGSWFNGREPDDDRYDLDLRAPDSYSARISINPSARWSVEMSYGHLASPEANEPDIHVDRFVASATYASEHVDVTAVVGRNVPSIGASTTAGLIEASAAICGCKQIILFGRLEALEKLGADLDLAPAAAGTPVAVGAFTLGGVYELHPHHGVVLGIGAHGTVDLVDATAAIYYGTTSPVGGFVFVEAHPARP